MIYGDNGGATGFLVGEENRGMACMFTMMNQARLSVAVQGVAIAERATQQALAYARERKQGRATTQTGAGSSAIIAHPDVKRTLLTMRALTRAARAICYTTVRLARPRAAQRRRGGANGRAPARLAAHSGCQGLLDRHRHRGRLARRAGARRMGYVEETGAAQHYRDARIAAIYEGTNGIQAIDLVTRKLPLAGGATVKGYIGEIRRTVGAVNAANGAAFGWTGVRLEEAVDSLERTNAMAARQPAQRPRHCVGRCHALSAAVRAHRRRGAAGRGGARRDPARRQRRRRRRAHRDRALLRREHGSARSLARAHRDRGRRGREQRRRALA